MPKGLKQSSAIIAISSNVVETAANTLTSTTIDLALSPLDNEVFVITMVDLDLQTPNLIAGTRAATDATLSTVARTTVGNLGDNDVVAVARKFVEGAAGLTTAVSNETEAPDQASPGMDYLAIVFTSDMFLNVLGQNNTAAMNVQCRVWGYRATASAAIYAAGVQQELLG